MKAKEENVIRTKSYTFALRVIKAYKFLTKEGKEFILSKQLMRSGTAVGALIEESAGAQSKADFINKLSIAYKEAVETKYWINLLKDSEYLPTQPADSLKEDIEELIKIIGSILKTLKSTKSNS